MPQSFQVTYEWADQYWSAKKLHKNYANSLDVYHHCSFHFDGYFRKPWVTVPGNAMGKMPETPNPYFDRLIDQIRPSESATILDYRRTCYMPVTKVPCGKVTNCLKKIVKSSDWKIDYSKTDVPNFITEENTLYTYCEKDFPKDDSIENWAYKNLVGWMLKDPNAVICVMPLSWEVEDNELLRPYPHIICCKDVYDFKEGQYCVFLSPYVSTYTDDKGETKNGKILMVVTTDCYYELQEIKDNQFNIVEHPHNIGSMPAWVMGGESKSPDPFSPYYESFIMPMLPSLDAAARDISDLQAEKVQHLFSTMWVIQVQSCANCQGTGNVLTEGKQSICPTCEGRGNAPFSPFRTLEINPNSAQALRPDLNIPTPPAGYLTKPTEMVKLMMEIIKTEINDSLAAINMEHLMDAPLDQSGLSKAYDEQETNNFVYSIAYHLVNELIVPVYYFVNELRYATLVPDKDTRKRMLPTVNTPERFDFLVQVGAVDDLIKITAPTAGVSEEVVDAAEMDYVHQKFQDSPDVIAKLRVIHDHNPLRSRSVDEINALAKGGMVDKIDVVLAIYIGAFITQILADPENDFMSKNFDEQHKILMKMAQEKVDALDAAAQIKQQAAIQAMQNSQVDAEGNPIGQVGQKQKDNLPGNKPRKRDRNDLNLA